MACMKSHRRTSAHRSDTALIQTAGDPSKSKSLHLCLYVGTLTRAFFTPSYFSRELLDLNCNTSLLCVYVSYDFNHLSALLLTVTCLVWQYVCAFQVKYFPRKFATN